MLGKITLLRENRNSQTGTLQVTTVHIFLGSDVNCDLRICKASPQHCLITAEKGKLATVRNLSVNNPTLLNGKPIDGADYNLSDKDIISVANKRFMWEYPNYQEKPILNRKKKQNLKKRRSELVEKPKLIAVVPPHRTETSTPVVSQKKRRKTLNTVELNLSQNRNMALVDKRVTAVKANLLDRPWRSNERARFVITPKARTSEILRKQRLSVRRKTPTRKKSAVWETCDFSSSPEMSKSVRVPPEEVKITPEKKAYTSKISPNIDGVLKMESKLRLKGMSSPKNTSESKKSATSLKKLSKGSLANSNKKSFANSVTSITQCEKVVSDSVDRDLCTTPENATDNTDLMSTPVIKVSPYTVMRSSKKVGKPIASPPLSTPKSALKLRRKSQVKTPGRSSPVIHSLKRKLENAIDDKSDKSMKKVKLNSSRKSAKKNTPGSVKKPTLKVLVKRPLYSDILKKKCEKLRQIKQKTPLPKLPSKMKKKSHKLSKDVTTRSKLGNRHAESPEPIVIRRKVNTPLKQVVYPAKSHSNLSQFEKVTLTKEPVTKKCRSRTTIIQKMSKAKHSLSEDQLIPVRHKRSVLTAKVDKNSVLPSTTVDRVCYGIESEDTNSTMDIFDALDLARKTTTIDSGKPKRRQSRRIQKLINTPIYTFSSRKSSDSNSSPLTKAASEYSAAVFSENAILLNNDAQNSAKLPLEPGESLNILPRMSILKKPLRKSGRLLRKSLSVSFKDKVKKELKLNSDRKYRSVCYSPFPRTPVIKSLKTRLLNATSSESTEESGKLKKSENVCTAVSPTEMFISDEMHAQSSFSIKKENSIPSYSLRSRTDSSPEDLLSPNSFTSPVCSKKNVAATKYVGVESNSVEIDSIISVDSTPTKQPTTLLKKNESYGHLKTTHNFETPLHMLRNISSRDLPSIENINSKNSPKFTLKNSLRSESSKKVCQETKTSSVIEASNASTGLLGQSTPLHKLHAPCIFNVSDMNCSVGSPVIETTDGNTVHDSFKDGSSLKLSSPCLRSVDNSRTLRKRGTESSPKFDVSRNSSSVKNNLHVDTVSPCHQFRVQELDVSSSETIKDQNIISTNRKVPSLPDESPDLSGIQRLMESSIDSLETSTAQNNVRQGSRNRNGTSANISQSVFNLSLSNSEKGNYSSNVSQCDKIDVKSPLRKNLLKNNQLTGNAIQKKEQRKLPIDTSLDDALRKSDMKKSPLKHNSKKLKLDKSPDLSGIQLLMKSPVDLTDTHKTTSNIKRSLRSSHDISSNFMAVLNDSPKSKKSNVGVLDQSCKVSEIESPPRMTVRRNSSPNINETSHKTISTDMSGTNVFKASPEDSTEINMSTSNLRRSLRFKNENSDNAPHSISDSVIKNGNKTSNSSKISKLCEVLDDKSPPREKSLTSKPTVNANLMNDQRELPITTSLNDALNKSDENKSLLNHSDKKLKSQIVKSPNLSGIQLLMASPDSSDKYESTNRIRRSLRNSHDTSSNFIQLLNDSPKRKKSSVGVLDSSCKVNEIESPVGIKLVRHKPSPKINEQMTCSTEILSDIKVLTSPVVSEETNISTASIRRSLRHKDETNYSTNISKSCQVVGNKSSPRKNSLTNKQTANTNPMNDQTELLIDTSLNDALNKSDVNKSLLNHSDKKLKPQIVESPNLSGIQLLMASPDSSDKYESTNRIRKSLRNSHDTSSNFIPLLNDSPKRKKSSVGVLDSSCKVNEIESPVGIKLIRSKPSPKINEQMTCSTEILSDIKVLTSPVVSEETNISTASLRRSLRHKDETNYSTHISKSCQVVGNKSPLRKNSPNTQTESVNHMNVERGLPTDTSLNEALSISDVKKSLLKQSDKKLKPQIVESPNLSGIQLLMASPDSSGKYETTNSIRRSLRSSHDTSSNFIQLLNDSPKRKKSSVGVLDSSCKVNEIESTVRMKLVRSKLSPKINEQKTCSTEILSDIKVLTSPKVSEETNISTASIRRSLRYKHDTSANFLHSAFDSVDNGSNETNYSSNINKSPNLSGIQLLMASPGDLTDIHGTTNNIRRSLRNSHATSSNFNQVLNKSPKRKKSSVEVLEELDPLSNESDIGSLVRMKSLQDKSSADNNKVNELETCSTDILNGIKILTASPMDSVETNKTTTSARRSLRKKHDTSANIDPGIMMSDANDVTNTENNITSKESIVSSLSFVPETSGNPKIQNSHSKGGTSSRRKNRSIPVSSPVLNENGIETETGVSSILMKTLNVNHNEILSSSPPTERFDVNSLSTPMHNSFKRIDIACESVKKSRHSLRKVSLHINEGPTPTSIFHHLSGVKKLFAKPHIADYTKVYGIKKLFENAEKSSYLDVQGVKKLFEISPPTPKFDGNKEMITSPFSKSIPSTINSPLSGETVKKPTKRSRKQRVLKEQVCSVSTRVLRRNRLIQTEGLVSTINTENETSTPVVKESNKPFTEMTSEGNLVKDANNVQIENTSKQKYYENMKVTSNSRMNKVGSDAKSECVALQDAFSENNSAKLVKTPEQISTSNKFTDGLDNKCLRILPRRRCHTTNPYALTCGSNTSQSVKNKNTISAELPSPDVKRRTRQTSKSTDDKNDSSINYQITQKKIKSDSESANKNLQTIDLSTKDKGNEKQKLKRQYYTIEDSEPNIRMTRSGKTIITNKKTNKETIVTPSKDKTLSLKQVDKKTAVLRTTGSKNTNSTPEPVETKTITEAEAKLLVNHSSQSGPSKKCLRSQIKNSVDIVDEESTNSKVNHAKKTCKTVHFLMTDNVVLISPRRLRNRTARRTLKTEKKNKKHS